MPAQTAGSGFTGKPLHTLANVTTFLFSTDFFHRDIFALSLVLKSTLSEDRDLIMRSYMFFLMDLLFSERAF